MLRVDAPFLKMTRDAVMLLAGMLLAGMLLPAVLVAQDDDAVPLMLVDSGIGWTEVTGEPSWWRQPMAKADRFSFRTKRQFRMESRVQSQLSDRAQRDVRDLLFDHLQPVLGDAGTLPVLEEMLRQTVLVDAQLGKVMVGTGNDQEMMNAGCMCWRTPIRSVVEKFDPSIQGRIEWVLLRSIVHWETAEKPPAWTRELPQRDGFFRCAFACPGKQARIAKRAGVSGVRANVAAHLVDLLTPVLGLPAAKQAAAAGIERLAPVAKVCVDARKLATAQKGEQPKRGSSWTAYCLWEVPTGPMFRALPRADRAAALAALRPE